jgi:hypothetical protein
MFLVQKIFSPHTPKECVINPFGKGKYGKNFKGFFYKQATHAWALGQQVSGL